MGTPENVMQINLFSLGTKLYNCQRWVNYRCVLVFVLRSLLHREEREALQRFLAGNALREQFFEVHPEVFAQLTRQFFFRGSTAAERLRSITETYLQMEQYFSAATMELLYLDEARPFFIGSLPYREDKTLSIDMYFCRGEIREGSMTLAIRLDGAMIYHVNFWIWQEEEGPVLYIGYHQGSKHGLALNKELTKVFFGYRPKNFILFALRILAQELGVVRLRAVSDEGFYANNHLRRDRKLRVSYDAFWRECGGQPAVDPRFYELPRCEPRKTMEEIPTRKRATYRRRFAFLDETEARLRAAWTAHMR